jgi:hypothetical protein
LSPFSSASPKTRTGDTWRNLRHELDRMHLVTLATADGRVAQRSATTSDQKTILADLPLTRTAQVPRLHTHRQRTRRLSHKRQHPPV